MRSGLTIFCLSFRDVEDLLAERGIIVSYETIRQWCEKFGPNYARNLKQCEGGWATAGILDEVFVQINGRQQYLWRAVDQDGDVIDIVVQPHRDQRGCRTILSETFARPGYRTNANHYRQTEALRCHGSIFGNVTHIVDRYANNRVEVSHQLTRQRERQMRRFKSASHAQRFLSLHDAVQNLFRMGRHLLRSGNHPSAIAEIADNLLGRIEGTAHTTWLG